ncbi:prohibitin family protein [bacterium]|nr:prohibitin family protein [bacterium]MBP5435958.1 prohibitin family protein [bacterium]
MRKSFIIILSFASMALGSCAQIEDTEVCFEKSFGKYAKEVEMSGLHFYNIVTTDLICVDARTKKHTGQVESYTKDLQVAKLKFFVNWAVFRDKAMELHKTLGKAYANRLQSETESAIKQIVGLYDSEALVSNRGKVEEEATKLLNERLHQLNMKADSVRLVDIEYSKQYENAIEAKQVAEQNAKKEKNITLQEEERSKQKLITAKAEAEAMKIKTDALAQSKSLIEYERVQVEKIQANRWNGQLPTNIYSGAPLPILNLK